ncbi:MAG: hypothetical protein ACP5TZ_03450 [Nitrososphaeria archaeon]
MTEQGLRGKLTAYLSDLLKHYGMDVKSEGEGCQRKVDLLGSDKTGRKFYFIIDISGEFDDSADTIQCDDKLFIVRYGVNIAKFYGNVTLADVGSVETLLRRLLGTSPETQMFEKTYADYLKLQRIEPEAFRSFLSELFNAVDTKLVESTLLKIYASGRNVVERIEPGKKITYIRGRFINVLEDLGLVFLSEIMPGNNHTLYIYSCTQPGIELSQKLAQETFLQKQSTVGLWLDRHDAATSFLSIWAAMKGSVYQNYPVCLPVLRGEMPKIAHVPCPLLGSKKCDELMNSQLPVELSLFADSILGGKTMSERIYSTLYELTASYLVMLSRVQISGNDAESICIVPELAKSIYDATLPDFVSKFSNSKLLKSVNSYSAAVSTLGTDLSSNEAIKLMKLYNVSHEDVVKAYDDLLNTGSVKKESDNVYIAANRDLLVKAYLEKIDALSAELEIV